MPISAIVNHGPLSDEPPTSIDTDLVRKYDKRGPRYAFYPTPNRFVEAYDARAHQTTLEQRNVAWGAAVNIQPLSLYVHIPFCNTVCHFCECNKVITQSHARGTKYLRYLEKEFARVAGLLKGSRRAEQVHLGGGTPTFLSIEELQTLMRDLGRYFDLAPGEYAVEIDPRTVNDDKTAALLQLGFNRMSLGVQDFDPDVQRAVNRVQSVKQTARVIDVARKHGVISITIDLIYGLPRQSVASFERTLSTVVALKPDRIALYSYTHRPAVFKPQRHINAAQLPAASEKLAIVALALGKLTAAGYVYIGLDHFALPHDELAIAAKHQGYTARPDSDLLAFGISAISKIGVTYSQNVKTLDEYYERLDCGELPVLRGIELSADDLLRRAVIHSLMCHFELPIEAIEIAHLIRFRKYFAAEWERIEEFAREGLVTIEDDWITVTARGRLIVHGIAMIFDRYLTQGEHREQFSRVI